MKKSIMMVIVACMCSILPLQAQQNIDEVLQYIEQSSKELQAQRRLTEAQNSKPAQATRYKTQQ